MDVLEAEVAMDDFVGGLAAGELFGDGASGLLAFLTASGGFAFATGGAAAAPDFLVVGGRDIGEGGEDRCGT